MSATNKMQAKHDAASERATMKEQIYRNAMDRIAKVWKEGLDTLPNETDLEIVTCERDEMYRIATDAIASADALTNADKATK